MWKSGKNKKKKEAKTKHSEGRKVKIFYFSTFRVPRTALFIY